MISYLYRPIFAPLLAHQKNCYGLLGLSAGHLALSALGLPTIPCPSLEILGLPCLGCGLSRAMLLFVQGEWPLSFRYHLFAPLFLLGFMLLITSLFLSEPTRQNLIYFVEKKEQKTGFVALFSISLVVYWLIRLIFWHDEFVSLIMFNR